MASSPPPEAFPWGEVAILFILSLTVIYLIQLTGKINLGLYIPWATPPLRKIHRRILHQYIRFYRHLDAPSRRKFERRVRQFIQAKKFIPRQMPTISSEMRVLLAATAAQITFGLPRLSFSYFRYVLVYPDDYYSTINKRYHKGEVNPRHRAIVVSWKSFQQGYMDPTSGRNVGLHEMAHALLIDHKLMISRGKPLSSTLLEQWQQAAQREIVKIANGENDYLRGYAATDEDEFFAVAVEYFFEKPISFRTNMPEIYHLLAQLLQLDTATLYSAIPHDQQ